MLSKERIEEIRKELESITKYSDNDLISREEWGTEITFEKALSMATENGTLLATENGTLLGWANGG